MKKPRYKKWYEYDIGINGHAVTIYKIITFEDGIVEYN